MTALQEHQFELDGKTFGLGLPISLDEGGFDTGSAEWRTQDADNPTSDGTRFGRDYLVGPTWGFQLFVDGTDAADALEKLAPLANAWRRDEKTRRTPGTFSTLRYCVGGRTRRVYGRPRRYSAPPNNQILNGYIPVTTDFRCADHLHYDDVQNTVVVPIVPATTGGVIGPVVGPVTTLQAPGPRSGSIVVDGDEGAETIITIKGPIARPTVSSAGWTLSFAPDFSLAYDQSVTIDTRAWVNTVLRNDGASVAGKLTRQSTTLPNIRLQPGNREIVFTGVDASGTASCTVRWRPAWTSL